MSGGRRPTTPNCGSLRSAKPKPKNCSPFCWGTTRASQPLKHLILEKTEGTPFFMEEVVQTLVEEGVLTGERGNYRLEQAPTALHISPTVQGVLAARIDRLAPDEKALLQQLAVIGREFPLSLVRQVITQPEEELYRLLASLQHKEFLYEQPAFPEVEYSFKHALTQEVAYGTVLQERRKALHERTAQAIEALYRDQLEDHYSDLAHHYSRSGNTQKAVEYLHLAGQQAVQRSANAEAISHLTTALELLKTLPDTPERAQQELALQLTLGVPLQVLKGHAAPEVGQTYNRVLELCGQVGETAQLFPALFGLWRFYFLRPDMQKARELAEQMMQPGPEQPRLLPSCSKRIRRWEQACFIWENCGKAAAHLEQGIALYDIHKHRSHAFLYGIDPGVYCLCFAGLESVVSGLSGPGTEEHAGCIALGPRVSASLYFGFCPRHYCDVPSVSSRRDSRPRAGRSTTHACDRAGFAYRVA